MHYAEFPDITDQTTAYVDCYVRTAYQYPFCPDSGFCFGTCGTSVPPLDTGVATVFDFLPTNSARGSYYTYETSNIQGFLSEFGDANQAGFQNISDGYTWQHTSYYLNDLINADRDIFAIGYVVGDTNPGNYSTLVARCTGLVDAIAIIVY
jgi:hypothetical protein